MKKFEVMFINEYDKTFLYKQLNAYDRKHLLSVIFYFTLIDIELQDFILHTTKIVIKELKENKNELLHNNK